MHLITSILFYTDKPSPPRNLEVTGLTAETADLKWDVPEDDGGSEITHYVVEKKNLQRKTWQEVGKPSELTFTVGDLHDQNQYLFRVFAANQYGVSEPVEMTEPVTAKNPFSKLKHTYFTLPTTYKLHSCVF